MAETLEGVLSEALLDELASDLGVDAIDLRKHPFFRVLKGRVLLTYPLRVPEVQFTLYEVDEPLANVTYFVPPANTIVFQAILEDSLIDAAQDFDLRDGATEVLADAFTLAESPDKRGICRVVVCDGVDVGYRQATTVEKNLRLWGLTFT